MAVGVLAAALTDIPHAVVTRVSTRASQVALMWRVVSAGTSLLPPPARHPLQLRTHVASTKMLRGLLKRGGDWHPLDVNTTVLVWSGHVAALEVHTVSPVEYAV